MRRSDKGTSIYYEVHAIHGPGGSDLKVVGLLQELEAAKYIEQQIEKFLGIKNVRVPGER